MRLSLLFLTLLFLGCAPKAVDTHLLSPTFSPLQTPSISTYDKHNERIMFYEFSMQNGILMQKSWGKTLPFRVEFMNLWVSGLGHDLRRLSDNHAESIHDTLMYYAHKQGMQRLYINQEEYIIDTTFAKEMVDVIEAYEEKMKRYESDKRFPLLLLPRL